MHMRPITQYTQNLPVRHIGVVLISIAATAGVCVGFLSPAYRDCVVREDIMPPGSTLCIELDGISNSEKFFCTYNDKEYHFYPNGKNSCSGLIGIPVDEQPGSRHIGLAYKGFWRSLSWFPITIFIKSKQFKNEHISFSRKKNKLYARPEVSDDVHALHQTYGYESKNRLRRGPCIWPLEGRITSPFGAHRIYNHRYDDPRYHTGIDIAAAEGTAVKATNSGRVILAQDLVLPGKTVVIDHGQGVLSIYKHLATISVQEGAMIAQGTVIGTVGSSGLATGAHLHWEMRVHAIPVNPIQWIEHEL
ncbi:MAG: peptidoglycan DD-metalloendopeptidase family protein [Elusimicrobia bacterium]|nr:peptidoglycan DD-metalloendopeptidase family protein [Elusimicrobiota bacterium]MBD3412209.1 peptidoglycan DD-metalloendopeptidase family protein [Elusimicrobiota bacterium]